MSDNKIVLIPVIKDIDPDVTAADICSVANMLPVYDYIEAVWIIQLEDGSIEKISNEEYEKRFRIFKTRYDEDQR